MSQVIILDQRIRQVIQRQTRIITVHFAPALTSSLTKSQNIHLRGSDVNDCLAQSPGVLTSVDRLSLRLHELIDLYLQLLILLRLQ